MDWNTLFVYFLPFHYVFILHVVFIFRDTYTTHQLVHIECHVIDR
jgi:hypothetical protein